MIIKEYKPITSAKNFFLIQGKTNDYLLYLGYNYEYTLKLNKTVQKPKSGLLLIESLDSNHINFRCKDVLDIGTGASAFLARSAIRLGACSVDAVDIDEDVICNINDNYKEEIIFYKGDCFEGIVNKKYDFILSNPPQLPGIQTELHHDIGGENGYEIVYKIISESKKFLKKGGTLFLLVFGFIGIERKTQDQGDSLLNLIRQHGFEGSILNKYIFPIRKGGVTEKQLPLIREKFPLYHFHTDQGRIYNEIYIVKCENV